MLRLKHIVLSISVAALGAGVSYAQPPHCPPGHAKKGWCDVRHDRGWRDDSRSERRAYEEGYRAGQREARWELSRRLPRDVEYVVVRDYGRYNLAAPPHGHYYAEVDGNVLLIQAATQLVLRAMR